MQHSPPLCVLQQQSTATFHRSVADTSCAAMGTRHRALTEWSPQLGSAFANEKVEKINAKAITVNLAMERCSAIAHQLGRNSASPVRRKLGDPDSQYPEGRSRST